MFVRVIHSMVIREKPASKRPRIQSKSVRVCFLLDSNDSKTGGSLRKTTFLHSFHLAYSFNDTRFNI